MPGQGVTALKRSIPNLLDAVSLRVGFEGEGREAGKRAVLLEAALAERLHEAGDREGLDLVVLKRPIAHVHVIAAVEDSAQIERGEASIAFCEDHILFGAVNGVGVAVLHASVDFCWVRGVRCAPSALEAPSWLVPIAVILDERACPLLDSLAAGGRFPQGGV